MKIQLICKKEWFWRPITTLLSYYGSVVTAFMDCTNKNSFLTVELNIYFVKLFKIPANKGNIVKNVKTMPYQFF